jgi:hypothetical protein
MRACDAKAILSMDLAVTTSALPSGPGLVEAKSAKCPQSGAFLHSDPPGTVTLDLCMNGAAHLAIVFSPQVAVYEDSTGVSAFRIDAQLW